MHICMMTSEFPTQQKGLAVGGVGYYTFNLCSHLIKKGHKTTVLTRSLNGTLCHERLNEIAVHRAPFIPTYPFHINFHSIFVKKVFRTMESDFDLVHLQIPFPPIVKTSLPVVVTLHSLTKTRPQRRLNIKFSRQLTDKIFTTIYSPFEREMLQNADLITCVSTRVATLIKDFYGLNSKIIGNAVDTNIFVPNNARHDTKHVLWVGRMIYGKGLFDLVKCAEYVCKEHPSISFYIAGSGHLRKDLRKLLKTRGLEKNVIMLGQLDRATLLKFYQNSAIFLLTSHVESFPNTVLEAMSCGTPVVATGVGEVPKLVKDGETGFLVPPKDYKAMAQKIIDLSTDEELRRRMGEASRRLVENEYNWNALSDKILDCYELVVARHCSAC